MKGFPSERERVGGCLPRLPDTVDWPPLGGHAECEWQRTTAYCLQALSVDRSEYTEQISRIRMAETNPGAIASPTQYRSITPVSATHDQAISSN